MTLSQSRQQVVQAARQGPYLFLQAALPYLDRTPDDLEIRLLALSNLSRLGLVGPALELIENRQEALAGSPELQEAVRVLKRQPAGHVPWETLESTFAANLAALLERFPSCRLLENELRQACRGLELFRCQDGNYQLSRRTADGRRQWLPALADWRALARQARVLPEQRETLCPAYFVEGVGFGELLRLLYDGTQRMFLTYRPRIHVLEPNPAQLAVWLHLRDLRQMLNDERFWLWLGEPGAGQFLAFHEQCLRRCPPAFVIRQPGWGPAGEPRGAAVLNALHRAQRASFERHRDAVLRKLGGRCDFAYYARRFANADRQPLRILGVTSRFTTFLQYSMRDILQTFAALGHETRLLIEPDDYTPSCNRPYVLSQIDEFLPDLLLIIDHNRHEFGELYDLPIPFCNWIQDELPNLFGPGCGSRLGPYDVVVGHIGELSARQSGYPPRQCHPLPMPVNPQVFSAEPVAEADRRKAECDICFVSNLSITAGRFLDQSTAQCAQPEIRRLLGALAELLEPRIAAGDVPANRIQTDALIRQTANELGFDLSEEDAAKLRRHFVERLVNIFFRHQPLHWAHEMGLDLHLYGRGWEQHPELGRYARGVAENGYHMRCIFQASRINLQLFPGVDVHQRLLEGLASGGFFLIRVTPYDRVQPAFARAARRCRELGIGSDDELWNAADPQLKRDLETVVAAIYAPQLRPAGLATQLRSYVRIGHRFDMVPVLPHYGEVRFATRAEFESRVKRYLANPPAREQIAAAQRARVLERFTYEAVLRDVLRFLADYFGERAAAAGAGAEPVAARGV